MPCSVNLNYNYYGIGVTGTDSPDVIQTVASAGDTAPAPIPAVA